jgi:hypothetical protein
VRERGAREEEEGGSKGRVDRGRRWGERPVA